MASRGSSTGCTYYQRSSSRIFQSPRPRRGGFVSRNDSINYKCNVITITSLKDHLFLEVLKPAIGFTPNTEAKIQSAINKGKDHNAFIQPVEIFFARWLSYRKRYEKILSDSEGLIITSYRSVIQEANTCLEQIRSKRWRKGNLLDLLIERQNKASNSASYKEASIEALEADVLDVRIKRQKKASSSASHEVHSIEVLEAEVKELEKGQDGIELVIGKLSELIQAGLPSVDFSERDQVLAGLVTKMNQEIEEFLGCGYFEKFRN